MQEYVGILHDLTTADPGYEFEVLDMSTSIRDETTASSVFPDYQLTGSPPGV